MSQTKLRASKQLYFDGDIDINSVKLTNAANGVNPQDLVTVAQLNALADNINAFQLKGTIDCSANPNYPAANAGHTYRVSVAGKIGGASGKTVAIGDLIECLVDSSATGDYATVGANWNIVPFSATAGGVTSSSTSVTDNAIVRMDGATGSAIQTSPATIDDNGSINIPTGQSYKINGSALTQDNIPSGTINKAYTATEQTKLAGIATGADVTSATNVGTSINGATAKATLVDGDKFAIIDSEASNVLKTSLWSVIKSTIKTFIMGNYVCREVPSGTKNGSNTAFTLANTPVSGSESLYINGILMNAGAGNDYTISGVTITMLTAPISTDTILCTYWK